MKMRWVLLAPTSSAPPRKVMFMGLYFPLYVILAFIIAYRKIANYQKSIIEQKMNDDIHNYLMQFS